jgi:uncharacterized coiled-coil protein SlyX
VESLPGGLPISPATDFSASSAIQEERIAQLESSVAELKQEIATLRQKLDNLFA